MKHGHGRCDRYVAKLLAIPTLPTEVEHVLARKAQAGDRAATSALIEGNLQHVAKMALMYSRRTSLPLDDLVAVGSEGLFDALPRFDVGRGVRFITYAAWWIRIRLTRHVHSTWYKGEYDRSSFRASVIRLAAECNRRGLSFDETVRHIERELGQGSADRIRSMVERLRAHDISVDELDNLSPVLCDKQRLPDDVLADVQETMQRNGRVRQAMQTLTLRERRVIEARAMADSEDVLTLEAIGVEFGGICRERVRQIEQVALKKLGKALEDMRTEETPTESDRRFLSERVRRPRRTRLSMADRSAAAVAPENLSWREKVGETCRTAISG